MAQIGTKKVGLLRRFLEGVFVGLGIAVGLVLLQSLLIGGMLLVQLLGL